MDKRKNSLKINDPPDFDSRRPSKSSDGESNMAAPANSARSVRNSQSNSPFIQNSHEFIEENISGALLDWLNEQDFYKESSNDDKNTCQKTIKDMAANIVQVIKKTPKSEDLDSILLEEIKKHILTFPLDSKQTSNLQFMNEMSMKILDHIKNLQLLQDMSLRHDQPLNVSVKKKAAVILLEDIANWIANLPINTNNTEEEESIKEQLENKLIHKIGELNTDSEIFDDDFMYDDILGDEVEYLLTNIPGENIKNNIPMYKKELLALVKKARKKIREENVGQIYKQKLCETISKTLPPFVLSVDGKASLEVLKNDVAEAFINMRYVGCNGAEITRLTKKINEEIYNFCNKYLRKCPASPLDTSKLNAALYNALRKIEEPYNESFTDDIELIKIKDEISSWAKELHLRHQNGQEKLQTNRMKSVLAKKIQEIENQSEFIPIEEYEEKMTIEIRKFLKKLPLLTENDDDIKEYISRLVKNLKDSEESRKFYVSMRHCAKNIVKGTSKAKLRISFNDASVNPCPIETFSQTPSLSTCPSSKQYLAQKSSCVQTPFKRMQSVGSQVNVTPNVIVNEYHWDSQNESSMQLPRVSCPCPAITRPSYAMTPQPQRINLSPRVAESYMQPGRRSCSPPVHYHPPSTIPAQRSQSPDTQRRGEFSPDSLKACLTTRPYPLQQFENRFIKPRDPDQNNPCNCVTVIIQHHIPTSVASSECNNDYDYQLPNNSAPCNCEPIEITEPAKQSSNQSFVTILDKNNTFLRENQQSTPRLPPGAPSQYPGQACPTTAVQEQSNIQDSQYASYPPYPGSPQPQSRIPRSHPEIQPMCSISYLTPSAPPYPQGPQCVPYTSSLQMPCSFDPRSPCYVRPEPSICYDDYGQGLGCTYRGSLTHLGGFDEGPQTCLAGVPPYQDWNSLREEFHYWDRDRYNLNSAHNNGQRRCKMCKHRQDDYGRRF